MIVLGVYFVYFFFLLCFHSWYMMLSMLNKYNPFQGFISFNFFLWHFIFWSNQKLLHYCFSIGIRRCSFSYLNTLNTDRLGEILAYKTSTFFFSSTQIIFEVVLHTFFFRLKMALISTHNYMHSSLLSGS